MDQRKIMNQHSNWTTQVGLLMARYYILVLTERATFLTFIIVGLSFPNLNCGFVLHETYITDDLAGVANPI